MASWRAARTAACWAAMRDEQRAARMDAHWVERTVALRAATRVFRTAER